MPTPNALPAYTTIKPTIVTASFIPAHQEQHRLPDAVDLAEIDHDVTYQRDVIDSVFCDQLD